MPLTGVLLANQPIVSPQRKFGENARDLLKAADRSWKKSHKTATPESTEIAKRIIRDYPNSPEAKEALFYIAEERLLNIDYCRPYTPEAVYPALQKYEEFLKKCPNSQNAAHAIYEIAYIYKGEADRYFKLGKLDLAKVRYGIVLSKFNEYLRKEPNSELAAQIIYETSKIYDKLGKHDIALANINKLDHFVGFSHNPAVISEGIIDLGLYFLSSGNKQKDKMLAQKYYRQAYSYCEKYIRLFPNGKFISDAYRLEAEAYEKGCYGSQMVEAYLKNRIKHCLAVERKNKRLSFIHFAERLINLYCRTNRVLQAISLLKFVKREGSIKMLELDDLSVNNIFSYLTNKFNIRFTCNDHKTAARAKWAIVQAIILLPENSVRGLKEIEVKKTPKSNAEQAIVVDGIRKKIPLSDVGGYYKENIAKITIDIEQADDVETYLHEAAHHFDVKGLINDNGNGIANGVYLGQIFYDISWEMSGTERIPRESDVNDFAHYYVYENKVNNKPKKIYDVYGMTNIREDFATFMTEYVAHGPSLRGRVRELMRRGNFELAAKYLFFKMLVMKGYEYDTDPETSKSLTLSEIRNSVKYCPKKIPVSTIDAINLIEHNYQNIK